VTFSKNTPNSRTVQVFINLKDNPSLDEQGFSPFGEVVEGMDVVDALYSEYGDGPPRGEGVYQAMAIARGDEYLNEEFPLLDRIQEAVLLDGEG
jgi:peptidyl-prolyl cis-trans isomerase A (cyclophilin A)